MTWVVRGELSLENAERLTDSVDQWADQGGAELEPVASYFEQADKSFIMEIFTNKKPAPGMLSSLLQTAGLVDWDYHVIEMENKDWVAESQRLLHPVIAGRFFIHGQHDRLKVPENAVALEIEAGQAFGTGRHETTFLCLEHLENLHETIDPVRILDLGTGSGVLAMAAEKIWPNAAILASDIDPIAIEVSRDNLNLNGFSERPEGAKGAGIALKVMDGVQPSLLAQEGPFDLVIANILAGPLMSMASDIIAATRESGVILLSGILTEQAQAVIQAYQALGCTLHQHQKAGDWSALTLTCAAKVTEPVNAG